MSNEVSAPKYPLEDLLKSDKFLRKMKAMLNQPGQAERFVQIGLNALIRTPALRGCSQESIINCLLKLAQINLEPDGYHAHLIPYGKVAQLIIDYKGLMTIIRRNPKIAVMKGNVIYKKDRILYREGSERAFAHEPTFAEPGLDNPVLAAYSFVKYSDGDWDVDILPVWKIELTRERSKAKDNGPWITDYDEMAIKTAIRHHSKRLPLRPEERDAVRADDDQFDLNPFENEQRQLPETKPDFGGDEQAADSAAETPRESAPKSTPRAKAVRAAVARPADDGADVKHADEHKDKPAARGAILPTEENPFNDDTVNEAPAPQPEPPKQEPEAPLVSPKGKKILDMINREGFSQSDVIDVLRNHEIGLGEAGDSGMTEDLPEDVKDLVIRQWGTIKFGVQKAKSGAQ